MRSMRPDLAPATIAAIELLFLALVSASVPAAAASCPKPALKVAIDIGHSRTDSGAVAASGKPEHLYNKRFAEELLSLSGEGQPGLELFIVNPLGESLKLPERTQRALTGGADLFISIHHDSVNDKYLLSRAVADGTSFYTDAFHGYSLFVSRENVAFEESRKLAERIGRDFKAAGLVPTLHHAEPIPGEGRELLDPDLGVYNAPFAVLRTATMPAVLVEVGVIANPKEEALLEAADHRRRIEETLLGALKAFCGG